MFANLASVMLQDVIISVTGGLRGVDLSFTEENVMKYLPLENVGVK